MIDHQAAEQAARLYVMKHYSPYVRKLTMKEAASECGVSIYALKLYIPKAIEHYEWRAGYETAKNGITYSGVTDGQSDAWKRGHIAGRK